MTYRAMGQVGLGAYYEFEPEEIYPTSAAGVGAYFDYSSGQTFPNPDTNPDPGMGSYYEFTRGEYYPTSGMGAFGGFSADSTWSGWVSCLKTPGAKCKAAVDGMRVGLGGLGYGALPMGEAWGSADRSAMRAFQASQGLQNTTGMPTKEALVAMEAALAAPPPAPPGAEIAPAGPAPGVPGMAPETSKVIAIAVGVALIGSGVFYAKQKGLF